MSDALLESLLSGSATGVVASDLLRDGLPTTRDEAWKYTSVKALAQQAFRDGDPTAATRSIDHDRPRLPGVDGTRLVFVNGVFRRDASHVVREVDVEIVADAPIVAGTRSAGSASDAIGAHARERAFIRLNDALLERSVRISVAAGVRAAQRVHLVFAGAPVDVATAVQLRISIELGAGATLDVIEHHFAGEDGGGDAPMLVNSVLDITVGEGAALTLTQLQDAAPTATVIRRSRFDIGVDASVALTAVDLGARMTRHDVDIELAGRGARLVSRGVFALRARQHADTHLAVAHTARDTTCDIVSRGVADGRARGVFHGAITVAAGADGADAQLRSNNLLLSDNAEIDTQPVLEIHADDVKAAHGATVGQLDENALFYLRSRGIDQEGARRILIGAFCDAVLADIAPQSLREHIAAMLAGRVSGTDTP